MKNKFKLLSDYQYTSSDKRIFLIKAGTVIEDYTFKTKGVDIKIDREIVDVNPQIFQLLDWKTELLSHLKVSKIPQPAQVSKKLVPFIEEILLSTTTVSDDSDRNNDILELENSIKRREARLNDNEDDINIRLKLLEKRELLIKSELSIFDKKDDELRSRLSNIKELENKISERESELNKKERDIELKVFENNTDIEAKHLEIQSKINKDIESINERESDIDRRLKEVTILENSISERESILVDRERDISIKEEELFINSEENNRISKEIEEWENLHWKFKRTQKPPSCE